MTRLASYQPRGQSDLKTDIDNPLELRMIPSTTGIPLTSTLFFLHSHFTTLRGTESVLPIPVVKKGVEFAAKNLFFLKIVNMAQRVY